MASGRFSLPQRRKVEETEWTVVLVDVTETPYQIICEIVPKESNQG